MPVGQINVEGDGWIDSDGIQTELKEDQTGPYVEIFAFLQEDKDLLTKLFDRVTARKEIKSLKIRIQKDKKVLHFEFGGCKPISGSWHVGHGGWVKFHCYKAGALVASRSTSPILHVGATISPIAIGLLREASSASRRTARVA